MKKKEFLGNYEQIVKETRAIIPTEVNPAPSKEPALVQEQELAPVPKPEAQIEVAGLVIKKADLVALEELDDAVSDFNNVRIYPSQDLKLTMLAARLRHKYKGSGINKTKLVYLIL